MVVVTVSTLLLLTGCVPGAAPVAVPSPSGRASVAGASSSEPAPTLPSTPSPSAVPASAFDPADPGTWIVDYDRVADVQVGGSASALAAAAGLPKVADTIDCPPGYGISVAVRPVTVAVLELASRGHDVPDPTFTYASVSARTAPDAPLVDWPSTAQGIRLGSTEAQLLAAYPGIRTTHSRYDDNMGYTTYAAGPSGDRYLVFQVAVSPSGARTVIDFQSSTTDSVYDVCD